MPRAGTPLTGSGQASRRGFGFARARRSVDRAVMETSKGQRKHERHDPCLLLGVRDARTEEHLGAVANISRGGLKLVGELPLGIGTARTLVIEVRAVFADLEDLTLEAEVRWQRAVEPAGTWQNGLEFTRPLPREAEPILTGLLARLEE